MKESYTNNGRDDDDGGREEKRKNKRAEKEGRGREKMGIFKKI
jgi:hypothetical protein